MANIPINNDRQLSKNSLLGDKSNISKNFNKKNQINSNNNEFNNKSINIPNYIKSQQQSNNYKDKNLNNNPSINKDKSNDINSIKPMDKILKKESITDKLVIGIKDKKSVFIPQESRYLNTIVLGTKGTGKTTKILPMLVEQDFKVKKRGVTIITTKHEMAYNLYALAKLHDREKDIVTLKPSINNEISTKFIWEKEYNYDYINEFIINYKEVIKKGKIVIIDMELLKHKSDGLRAIAMLLLQLQLDCQETDITQKKAHFIYIDDAFYYLPFLEYLLSFSDEYNLGLTLFFQSRNQFNTGKKDYTSLIDNNVRNTILLNSLTKEDVEYYSNRIYEEKGINNFVNRQSTSMMYEIIDSQYMRKAGTVDYRDSINWKDIIEDAKKVRAKLLKKKRKEVEKKLLTSIKIKYNEPIESENQELDSTEEEKEIKKIEEEIITKIPVEQLDLGNDIGEPVPVDVSSIDEELNEPFLSKPINESIQTNDVKKEVQSADEVKKLKELRDKKLKEIIRLNEKVTKRKVATAIFNKMTDGIDYCDDDFTFSFE